MIFSKIVNIIAKSNDSKEIVQKSIYALALRVFSYALGFVFTYLIAVYYDIDTQGVFSIIFTLVALLSLVGRLGLQTAMVKWLSNYFYNNDNEKAKYFFWRIYKLVFLVSTILSILLFFCGGWLANSFFKKPSLLIPIEVISYCIPFLASTEIIANYFRSKKEIITFSFYNFTSKFVLPVLLLVYFIFNNSRRETI